MIDVSCRSRCHRSRGRKSPDRASADWRPRLRCFATVAALFVWGSTSADTLYISSGGRNALEYDNVKVITVNNGQIVYDPSTGNETSKPLADVARMHLDDEPALNSAEDALAAGKWDDAVDGYLNTFKNTTKPWLRDWTAFRLLTASQKSGRFDAAATAYIAMLQRDPASAAKYKPQLPASGSTYLDSAASQVNTVLANGNLTDQQRMALLNFDLDLQKARNDAASQQQIQQQLDALVARDPNNPAAVGAIARRNIGQAEQALQAKDFAKAQSIVDSGKNSFVDPLQQADALYILAEAQNGLLAGKNDPAALKDVGLAYMRVVANFKDLPSHPHVADSLLKTAQIEEKLNEPAVALQLYQQIVQQYPNDPATATAQSSATRLTTAK